MLYIHALQALFFQAIRCTIKCSTEAQRLRRRVTRRPAPRTAIAQIIKIGVVGVGKCNSCLHRARATPEWHLHELVEHVVTHNQRGLRCGESLTKELTNKCLQFAKRRTWIDSDLPRRLAAELPQYNLDLPIKQHPGLRRHSRCPERLRAEVLEHHLVNDQRNGRRGEVLAKELANWLLQVADGRLPVDFHGVGFAGDSSAAKLKSAEPRLSPTALCIFAVDHVVVREEQLTLEPVRVITAE